MPDILRGKLSQANYFRKLSRIYETRKQVGAITNAKGHTISTTIQLFVPLPSDVRHLPGIFLSISNGNGTTFVRLTPEEFQSIHEWMSSSSDMLLDAFNSASARRASLIREDREYHGHSSTTPIESKILEESALADLLKKRPFEE